MSCAVHWPGGAVALSRGAGRPRRHRRDPMKARQELFMRTRFFPLAGLLLLAASARAEPGGRGRRQAGGRRRLQVARRPDRRRQVHRRAWPARTRGQAVRELLQEGPRPQGPRRHRPQEADRPLRPHQRRRPAGQRGRAAPARRRRGRPGQPAQERQDKLTVKDKDADGVYKVSSDSFPLPVYFRVANGYAYAAVQNKEAVAKDRLLAPDKVLPARTHQPGVADGLHVDAIPEKYKDAGR